MCRSGLIFAAILAAAVLLRFYDIESTGVYSAEDSQTLMDARAKYEELRVIGGLVAGKWQELRGGPDFPLSDFLPQAHARLTRYQPALPEYLTSYLGALAMLIWGFTPWLGNMLEAFFGVGCVAALYVYARQLTSRRVALLAAGMLAVSSFHIYCSRNTVALTLPLFWWLLAFHVHTRWGRRAWRKPWLARRKPGRLFVSGILAGLAAISSWQIILALPALFAAHALICLRQRTRSRQLIEMLRGGFIIVCGILTPILALEAVHYFMFLLFRSVDLLYPHTTFFEAAAHWLASHAACSWYPAGLLLFPYFVGSCEGWLTLGILTVLLIAGMTYIGVQLHANAALRQRPSIRLPALYLASAILVPAVLHLTAPPATLHLHAFVWPFLLLLIATGAVALWRGDRSDKKWRHWLVAGVLIVAASSSLSNGVQVFWLRSAYPEVLQWLRAQGETTIASSQPGPVSWYLACEGMEQPGEASPHGFVTDWQELREGRYPEESSRIVAGAEPVIVFEYRFDRIFLDLEAIPRKPSSILRTLVTTRDLDLDRARRVPVYRLSDTVPAQKPPISAIRPVPVLPP
ncbi:MAG TPA: glycosyltransferase family 39 protein [Candidatus Hydrogenedentes bacterium]|jgi:hypothetical protein|nr:glycosyltransferase family 39 protein [Candidatus Hydrogenedentota bacterium]